jgi:hypothetical protein
MLVPRCDPRGVDLYLPNAVPSGDAMYFLVSIYVSEPSVHEEDHRTGCTYLYYHYNLRIRSSASRLSIEEFESGLEGKNHIASALTRSVNLTSTLKRISGLLTWPALNNPVPDLTATDFAKTFGDCREETFEANEDLSARIRIGERELTDGSLDSEPRMAAERVLSIVFLRPSPNLWSRCDWCDNMS